MFDQYEINKRKCLNIQKNKTNPLTTKASISWTKTTPKNI